MAAQGSLEIHPLAPRQTAHLAGSRPRVVAVALVALAVVYVVLVRPSFLHWGATDQEIGLSLPGDTEIPAGAIVSTRALTIHAPAAQIWPWIVQIGQGRGGFYSYAWLENLFAADMHNADRILPQFQNLKVGDRVSLQADGPASIVTQIEPGRALVMQGWTFYLQPIDEQTTRLIVRYPLVPGATPFEKFYKFAIFEPAHFIMESGMMMGIKDRAERNGGTP